MGGAAVVRSTPGVGSTFSLVLPLPSGAATRPSAVAPRSFALAGAR